MDYIEMAAAPKGMFEQIIPNDGLRVPFNANGPGGSGFLSIPVPIFAHGKPLSSVGMATMPSSGSGSELSRRGGVPTSVIAGMSSKGTQMTLANSDSGGLGAMHLQMPGESGSSLQGDDLTEKGKRSRGEGGRGSRGGGTSSRKRTRAGQSDSLTPSEAMRDASVSAGAVPTAGRTSGTVHGARPLQNPSGEKGDKTSTRRHSGQGLKRGEKKQSQMVATSTPENLPQNSVEADGYPNGWSSGILDIYGLRARAMDVSRLMVDIRLDDLLSKNFEVPKFSLKDMEDKKMEFEDDLAQQIDGALHLLPKRAAMGDARPSKIAEAPDHSSAKGLKYANMTLDRENPIKLNEENQFVRSDKPQMKMRSDIASAIELEAGEDNEVRMGTAAVPADGSLSSQVPVKFAVGSLPLHSVESFMGRLKLMPSEPLESLIAQARAEGERIAGGENCNGGSLVDLCRKNGSIPPLFSSYPHVGPLKAETNRYAERVWIRAPMAENSWGKDGTGLNGKDPSNGAEEDAAISPSSRLRKLECKDKVQSPDAIHGSASGTPSLSSGQIGPSRTSSMVDPTTNIKEEPRQVENAVGFSSEGNENPMEIDSGRVENGSVPTSGADGTVATLAMTSEVHIPEEKGEAARPLEAPATLAGPQDMDIVLDKQTRPAVSTLAEVKQEKVEQTGKGTGESSGGASQGPIATKEEVSLALPSLDLKINGRSSSPPQADSPSSLQECPGSPRAQAAAWILCSMANSTPMPDQDKIDGEREKRRRVFHAYPGAPAQKSAKSIRVNNSTFAPGDGGRDGRRSADGGSVPPSKALVSERRKSLSQVNDATDKPSHSSPRNSNGGGISTGSRVAAHTASRSSNHSIKVEKVAAREPSKEPSSTKELVGRGSSSLPPLSNGGPALKNGHKGVKTNSYLHSSNPKGSVATASFVKVPAACTTQRVVSGGTSSRSSRTVHNSNSIVAHGPPPVGYKSSRHGIPDNRQKTKTEVSGRGSKPSRD